MRRDNGTNFVVARRFGFRKEASFRFTKEENFYQSKEN